MRIYVSRLRMDNDWIGVEQVRDDIDSGIEMRFLFSNLIILEHS